MFPVKTFVLAFCLLLVLAFLINAFPASLILLILYVGLSIVLVLTINGLLDQDEDAILKFGWVFSLILCIAAQENKNVFQISFFATIGALLFIDMPWILFEAYKKVIKPRLG
jgi:hypothetical protein